MYIEKVKIIDREKRNIKNTTIDIKENKKGEHQFENATTNIREKDLNDKDKMVTNRSEDVTEFLDAYDVTEEPCVGDSDYCNMTEEQYLEMLNDYIYPQSYEWVLIAIYAVMFIIGLIGNALVCIAVYRNPSMRKVTNYLMVNLAVADFMVILICLPPTVLWDVTKTWLLGTAMCRIVLYFQSVSGTVSVLTLTCISVDRWYAICFPLKFKSTTSRGKSAILIIWMVSLLFNLPEFVVLQVHRKIQLRYNAQYLMQCAPTWSDEIDLMWHLIKAFILYTLPLLLMTIVYFQIVKVLWSSDTIPDHNNWLSDSRRTTSSTHPNASIEGQLRSRRKAAKMMIAVVILFAVCYLPVHLLSIFRVAYEVQQTEVVTCTTLISHFMCYGHSAFNPVIYNLMSRKYRRRFHRSHFKCLCCCYNPPPGQQGASSAAVGSSRACTTRTVVRRNDFRMRYRLTQLSQSNPETIHRDTGITNTSFIENINCNSTLKGRDNSIRETARFTINSDVRGSHLGRDLFVRSDKNRDIGYIARSTNSIDCKPYYDCYKGQAPSGRLKQVSFDKIDDEGHSDTYADYRECDNDFKEFGFKFKFNRSLNSF